VRFVTTPLLPTFEKRIADATDQILRKQVDPWLFMPQGLSVTKFDGRPISYHGIKFEGSPRLVFWSGYIQPFLEHLITSEIAAGVSMARERRVDARQLLPEIQGLLLSAISKVFTRMTDVDRRLRGDGFPEQVPLRNIQSDRDIMAAFVDRHIQAELSMWQSKSALQRWYDDNKALVWVIGLLLSVVGIVASFL
jgi:hypothetical protein